MNKKGFVFIETIITVVVLSTALLIIYSSYSNSIYDEKERVYYDDIAYIYRTYYIKEFLINNSNIEFIKNNEFDDSYITPIGHDHGTMFTPVQKEKNLKISLERMTNQFNVNTMLLVSKDFFTNCYDTEAPKCKAAYEIINNSGLKEYMKTINGDGIDDYLPDSEKKHDFYLVVQYMEKSVSGQTQKCDSDSDLKCTSFYAILGI